MTATVSGWANAADRPLEIGADQSPKARSVEVEILSGLFRGTQQISEHIRAKELRAIHADQMTVSGVIEILGQRTSLEGEKRAALKHSLQELNRKLVNTHRAADAGDQTGTERAFENEVLPALQVVKNCYPENWIKDAQAFPEKNLCPMHPEVVGKRNDTCPKCGMRLKPAGPLFSVSRQQPAIRASIKTDVSLGPGVRVNALLRLFKENGLPVLPNDLQTAHTEKIHLLIIDKSLTDYHHEHPRPTGIPGEYRFIFTPKRPGPYRVWADLLPMDTGRQEYVMIDIASTLESDAFTDTKVTLKTVVDGLNYDLAFEKPDIKAKQPVRARLKISYPGGKSFAQLEPIMGTFAHLVGFHEDYKTILHIHPMGDDPTKPDDRGGPELEFTVYAPKSGFIRLFAQVRIGGASKFAPFCIQVLP